MTRHHHRISVLPTALLLALLLSLSACGLGDSGGAAVTAAKLKAHEAEGARATKEQLERQLADSQEQAAQRQKKHESGVGGHGFKRCAAHPGENQQGIKGRQA